MVFRSIGFWLLSLGLVGCIGEVPDVGAPTPEPEPEPPPPACDDPQPLDFGDMPWAKAPFEVPGQGESDDGGDDGEGEDGGPMTTGVGFIEMPDGGGVSLECDVWAQDCPNGQKCMPWSNDGGSQWNASRCSPVGTDPGAPGDPCTVEGTPFSGVDDCDLGVVCFEPDENLEGTCVGLCQGNEANPSCAQADTWCWIDPQGFPLCLPSSLCAADDVCRCMCPEGEDPDCTTDRCTAMEREREQLALRAPPPAEAQTTCPDSFEPAVLYMSNDDSNSQASPVLARRRIRDGAIIGPNEVRIHEFLNYYDFTEDNPADWPVAVDMQMRRSDGAGEFTLLLTAQGRAIAPEDRAPFNLVFSLDTSGSMGGERIELLKESMTAIAGSLHAGDVVSVVTWSTSQQVQLEGLEVSGPHDPRLISVIESLEANGSTDLHAGLTTAYALANAHHRSDGINRVVLISDGGANTGVTDIDLIASEAHDGDGEGTYLVGVGVGTANGYRDDLMDAVTDAGKGAYIFVDEPTEAWRSFGDHFLANMAVAARDVRMKLTLPWYFGVRAFHGEEYSPNPAEVTPQHLAPNDTMAFHQIVGACDPSLITTCDVVEAQVTYRHPITGAMLDASVAVPIGDLVQRDASLLRKADAVVAYAKSLIVIGYLIQIGRPGEARQTAHDMAAWLLQASIDLDDDEVVEMADLMQVYATSLDAMYGG